ncbi:MAG: c-type cytochrome [Acidimicrobiia bacterium]|nr:c-type cytochrome [Acidimicrobiia bacterium]
MKRIGLMVGLVILIAACGSADEPELLGEELFTSIVVGGKAGCSACHSTAPSADGVGPSLAGIGSVAGTRVAGMAAGDYLRESITDPDSHLVGGYASGVMPKGWDLSDAQIDSLVEYLLGL